MKQQQGMANSRGITPIISVVLLLMMTVAVAGLAWVWLQGMATGTMDTTKNMTDRQMTQMLTVIDISDYSLECNPTGSLSVNNINFQVSNRGSSTINVNSVLIEGKVAAISPSVTNKQINPGAIRTINVSSVITGFNATNEKTVDVMISATEGYAKKTMSLSGVRCNLPS